MKRFVLMVAMLALSGAAFASTGGEGGNTNCNGVGNPNSPCVPGGSGGGGGNDGGGGAGGGGGSALATVTNTNTNTNVQGQMQGQIQGQVQGQQQNASAVISIGSGGSLVPNAQSVDPQASPTSTSGTTIAGNATAPFSNANYVENNSQVGDVSATGGNATANVGDVSATGGNASATGGEGGSATVNVAPVVEQGAVQIAEGAVQSNYTYKEVKQAPAIGQGSFAIYGCNVGGNAGASGPGWAGFLGFGWTPQQCYDFMLAQAYQSIGEKKAVCDILKNSKAGKRQEKRGIKLPECEPEVQTVVVPAPVPVDLSPYATKEELNRAFKASQSK